jgi:hypothetical protein
VKTAIELCSNFVDAPHPAPAKPALPGPFAD